MNTLEFSNPKRFAKETFELQDAIIAIWERRILVVIVFLATLIAVAVATVLCPKSFSSEAKLFVRLGRENVGVDATATLGEAPAVAVPMSRESEIISIAEIVKSKHFLEQVVDQIGPDAILKKQSSSSDQETSSDSPGIWDKIVAGLQSTGILSNIANKERAIIRLDKKIRVEAIERSNVVSIYFKSHSPELAQKVVKALF